MTALRLRRLHSLSARRSFTNLMRMADGIQSYIYEQTGFLVSASALLAYTVPLVGRLRKIGMKRGMPSLPHSWAILTSTLTPDHQSERTTGSPSSLGLDCSEIDIKGLSFQSYADDSGFVDCLELDGSSSQAAHEPKDSGIFSLTSVLRSKHSSNREPLRLPSSDLFNAPLSMSRRRLASNIPVLQCQVPLPRVPSVVELTNSDHNSTGLTVSSSTLRVPAVQPNRVPITPVDQVMDKPEKPPSIRRRVVKRVAAFEESFSQAWGISPDLIPPLSSPCLIQAPAGLLSISQDSVFPTTPLEQVMSVPVQPPELPRRPQNQTRLTHEKCSGGRERLRQANASLAPRISSVMAPSPTPLVSSSRKSPQSFTAHGQENSFDLSALEATPRPPSSSSQAVSRSLKIRPPSLSSFTEGDSFELGRRSLKSMHLSPVLTPSSLATDTARLPVGKLPLGSPFFVGTAANGSPTYALTPLVGPSQPHPRTNHGTGTPSYFAARSYFVNN
jgi:hypothetical protein